MTPSDPISLVIVDDQAMLRGALAALLELEDDLTVVGVAGDGDEAVRVVSDAAPDVCLMDIQMPGMDGSRRRRRCGPRAPRPGCSS